MHDICLICLTYHIFVTLKPQLATNTNTVFRRLCCKARHLVLQGKTGKMPGLIKKRAYKSTIIGEDNLGFLFINWGMIQLITEGPRFGGVSPDADRLLFLRTISQVAICILCFGAMASANARHRQPACSSIKRNIAAGSAEATPAKAGPHLAVGLAMKGSAAKHPFIGFHQIGGWVGDHQPV